jgi:hypothetical protein
MSEGWQGQKGSNPRPTVLETVALPTELYPYAGCGLRQVQGKVKGFCLPEAGQPGADHIKTDRIAYDMSNPSPLCNKADRALT